MSHDDAGTEKRSTRFAANRTRMDTGAGRSTTTGAGRGTVRTAGLESSRISSATKRQQSLNFAIRVAAT